jgi:HSP20 family molecular chaperone IbpA
MAMSRYNPFESLIPPILRDSSLWGMDLFGFGRSFPVDIYERVAQFDIEAALPGVKPEDLKVMATSFTITIRAATSDSVESEHRAEEQGKRPGGYVRRERYSGVMTRVIELPEAINPTQVRANYKHGVLKLEAPKAGAAESTTVNIQVGE